MIKWGVYVLNDKQSFFSKFFSHDFIKTRHPRSRSVTKESVCREIGTDPCKIKTEMTPWRVAMTNNGLKGTTTEESRRCSRNQQMCLHKNMMITSGFRFIRKWTIWIPGKLEKFLEEVFFSYLLWVVLPALFTLFKISLFEFPLNPNKINWIFSFLKVQNWILPCFLASLGLLVCQ